ncbi:response regulator transcription factor [Paenibacillus sp. NEAU-GSW1]|uniref:response regulator transcription factor n=1 Tax=Paenibacillus sp. NEAU-GSW1 TaxID=2682486 RepID=UPI0012E24B13|nr:response regulator transcription factor [Paenibacillus sp. NEAU-GSW1]MUT67005.1 response regulator [Paenibacillus sp. NEAU-GSW1]
MTAIKVLLVEDDLDWIKAMTVFLNKEADIEVVGAASSSEEALRIAAALEFDVALLDIQLKGSRLNGIQLAVEMNDANRKAKIIMLTSLNNDSVMTDAFTAGAFNYIEKTKFKELPHAIRSACHNPEPMEALLKELSRLKREEQLKELTAAEREVFELIEDGYTQPQIEKKLYKAESTLKNQVNKMLKKLGVKSSKEAIEKVKRKGL